jgi:hypothetical protein
MNDSFGVLIDLHQPRQDGGAPALWDGWYSNRQLALEALALVRRRYPDADVCLVRKSDE